MLRNYRILLFLILASSIPLLSLLKPGLPLTHDGQDHVARIANFYQNLSEGNIIPRWAGNLNWGYGHPILEFLYPLPSYLASLFHFFGFNLIDSIKLVFGLSFIVSGMAMYIFTKELLKDGKAAFLASLLYVIAPYRFVDLFVRGAIGENIAFVFPPLVFYFLLKLSKSYSKLHLIGGAFSFALLNLAHNAISLMFIPLFFIYALFLILQSKSKLKLFMHYLFVILLGFGLSAFFLLPAFMEGKYTLRDVVTKNGEYVVGFVHFKDFFYSAWSYGGTLALNKQIGIVHWIGIFGSIIATYFLYRNKNKLWIISLGGFFIFWAALFLMTSVSNPIWQAVTTLQKFQFPWRFLSITVFVSALLGGMVLSLLSSTLKKILLIILIISLFFVNKDYWKANGYIQKPESFFTGVYNGTTDTGESAPIWSVRFMEKRPASKVEIIKGKGEIIEKNRKITSREYKIMALDKVRILENTLYFPGWTVFIDGKKQEIEFQDQNYRGLITFFVDKGEHIVNIIYKETKIRLLSNFVSLASIIIVVATIIFQMAKRRIYNKK